MKIETRARLARAKLETAEELSRNEKIEEAKETFIEAAKLFEKARELIETKCDETLDRKQKELAITLLDASEKRHEYCLGRIALEEGKIQDRKGNHLESSRKYASAARIFESSAIDEEERSRELLLPKFYLCQALARMMMAEETMSSKAYDEAAELFDQAKTHSADRETGLLALANNRFCKALASGTEFEITRDPTAYSNAKRHMEVAEGYYLRANQGSASEYARATLELMDAYMYITKAETGTDLSEKAKYYTIAEKTLKASSEAYLRAKYPEKSAEVQKLLDKIDERQQMAVSLMRALPESSTKAKADLFSALTPAPGELAGFDKFAHAEFEAKLTISKVAAAENQVKVKLDIVNIGRQPGLLLRIQGLIPPGFKVTSSAPKLEVDGDVIEMKGKRLEPLTVDSIRLSLQITETGIFDIKPQITYVDEVGNFKDCRLNSATLTIHPRARYAELRRGIMKKSPAKTDGAMSEKEIAYLASKAYRDQMIQFEIDKSRAVAEAYRSLR